MKFEDMLNKIICGDCLEVMKDIPDNSIDLIVTSPPYFNEKEYSQWNLFEDYLSFVRKVYFECNRILSNGCRIIVNVGDIYSKNKDILPLNAKTELLMFDAGLIKDSTIVWDKSLKGAKNTAWGSWCMPSNPCVQSYHEILLVFRKEGKRKIKDKSYKIDRAFFLEHIQSVWRFLQETKNMKHPAPFPEELPSKCIRLWTYPNEIVLDPFMGSGTTAVACKILNRHYIGIELNPDYCKIAKERLNKMVQIDDWLK